MESVGLSTVYAEQSHDSKFSQEAEMKKMIRNIKSRLQNIRAALGRLLRAPASRPALQPVPVAHPRRAMRRK
jgi:hypothetical protein